MKALPPANGFASQPQEEERRNINSELWHACAGPLVSLPSVGSLVVYFPQGHSEQVAATMQKETDTQIPNYPNLPSMLVCQLHNVTLHADGETDEVYAQMTLQPVNTYNKDAILTSETGVKPSKHPTDFFCKTLTASDTSTHGGFSVPRRSAETIFPPLDYSQSPPAQEIVARDLHDNVWTFRHIYRGQPKRHLLTTGWSVFVSAKRLFAGDSVLFIRDEKQQLLLGIRRANRQQPAVTSSVLSSDSMHIGVLAAAAHAASSQSPFTVFYNPRASPSEFVIPFSKYHKAMCGIQVSLGMRFRMMFETEESGVRRYMGTVTGISDLDPVRWPNSQWRNIQVGWDESSAGEKRKRVSIWEIEPIATPFFLCPPPFFRPKRPRFPGILGDESELESVLKRSLPWYGDDLGITNLQASTMPGLLQWMNMQPRQDALNQPIQPDYGRPMTTAFQNTMASKMPNSELSKTLNALQQTLPPISGQFNIPLSQQSTQLQQAQLSWQQQQQQHQPVTVQQQNPLQQVDQNHLLPQPRLLSTQVEQQLQSQKASQQLQPSLAQQLHSPTQQLHQKVSQPQTQTQLQSQLQRTQQHHQRFQQLPKSTNPFQQQPSLQVEHNLQRVQQEPQQQPSSIQTPQQFHPYQNQIVGSSGEQVQHPFQMPEIRDQLLQPTGSRTMAAGNVMPQSKAQCAFTETDALSCSTSSGNSYSLQNILSRATNSVLMPDEKCQNPNIAKANSESLHVPHPVSNVTEEHINSLLPPIKETNHASMHPYLGTQPTQMEAPSTSGSSFALAQSDANISQSMPLLNQQSSAVMLRDSSPNADTLAAPQRNSFSTGKDIPSLPSFSTGKDIQPQLCAPIASQAFGVPEIPLSSGVSGEDGIMEEAMLQTTSSWQQPTPPVRTYTKVRKLGAVGRSIDVTRCKNYDELRRELARLFGLEGQLEDPQTSGWQLVFVDNENDVLLVGDDPWEEFVSCVRCIRILSPSEVLQMSQEGLELLNNLPLQQQACSSSDGGILWRDHGDQNSNNPSAGSFDH